MADVRILLLMTCVLSLSACAGSPAAPGATVDERFTLAPGQSIHVEPLDTTVQFVEVTGDSRCPGDALCITGGDAIVRVRLFQGLAAATRELHTGDASLAAVTWRGARVALVELQPYPFSFRPILPEDYRATMVVSQP
ncbi:MAG: hypothetical protein AB7O32_04625 [Vicinamibacterales bacterium]